MVWTSDDERGNGSSKSGSSITDMGNIYLSSISVPCGLGTIKNDMRAAGVCVRNVKASDEYLKVLRFLIVCVCVSLVVNRSHQDVLCSRYLRVAVTTKNAYTHHYYNCYTYRGS